MPVPPLSYRSQRYTCDIALVYFLLSCVLARMAWSPKFSSICSRNNGNLKPFRTSTKDQLKIVQQGIEHGIPTSAPQSQFGQPGYGGRWSPASIFYETLGQISGFPRGAVTQNGRILPWLAAALGIAGASGAFGRQQYPAVQNEGGKRNDWPDQGIEHANVQPMYCTTKLQGFLRRPSTRMPGFCLGC